MGKSPERLRAMARQVREAAEREPDPEIRKAMALLADGYEQLAAAREKAKGVPGA